MATTVRYRTYVEGRNTTPLVYEGTSLEDAVRAWDRETYSAGTSVPGGIHVAEFDGDLQTRDGWIIHVHTDGTVYLNPNMA